MPVYSPEVTSLALQRFNGRLSALRDDRLSWFNHWADLAQNFQPRRYRWFISPNQYNRGSAANGHILDETGMLAARTCAAGMLTGLTSPTKPWFRLAFRDPSLNVFGPAKLWSAEVEKRMMRVLAQSNYYQSMGIFYLDEVIFGTAAKIIYDDSQDVIRCYNPCLGEFYSGVDNRQAPSTMYREFVFTIQQIVDEFGLENCSQDVQMAYRQSGSALSREVTIAHAIEPNTDLYASGERLKLVPSLFKYRECYWELNRAADRWLRVQGFHEQPHTIGRWLVTSNDAYASSCPGMDALAAAKQVRQEQLRKAEGIDKSVRPPMVAHVSMKNEPKSQLPGDTTYVTDTQNAGYKPAYEVQPRLAELTADIQEVQNRIREIFFVPLFMMISNLETVRTATEIDARREEKLIQLGPVIERNENEVLDKDIDRIFGIMSRRRDRNGAPLIPPAPPELHGQPLVVQYISMLAESQRAASTAAIERLFGLAGNISAVKPEVLDNIDFDQGLEEYADLIGVSPKLIVPLKAVLATRQARAQQQQAIQALQVGQASAETGKVLADTKLGAGQSALDYIMGNAA